jgi:hypothetical protein
LIDRKQVSLVVVVMTTTTRRVRVVVVVIVVVVVFVVFVVVVMVMVMVIVTTTTPGLRGVNASFRLPPSVPLSPSSSNTVAPRRSTPSPTWPRTRRAGRVSTPRGLYASKPPAALVLLHQPRGGDGVLLSPPRPGTRERGLASGGDHVSRGPCEVEPSNNDDDDDDDDGSGDPAVVVVVFVFIFVVVVVGGAFVEVPVSASPGRFVVFVVG